MTQEEKTKQVEAEEAAAAAAAAAAQTEDETPAAPEAETVSSGAKEAFAKFLAALSPQDKETLCTVLDRLREYEADRAAKARAAEEASCLAAMEQEPAFAGISERADAISSLIGSVSWLQALPVRDRLAAACYIDRGMRWHTPTPEEKLQSLLSDPALMRALAERQATMRLAQEKSTPPMHTGTGLSPATVTPPPKSLGEAKREAKRSLRVK